MNYDIDQMHIIVLHIGEAFCQSNWNYKNICSPFTRIYYVTKGHAQIELPNKTQNLQPGFMYIIPAFTLHSYICHEDFFHYYIHIYNESDHDILEDWILPTEIKAENGTLTNIQKLHKLCPGMELVQIDPKFYDNINTFLGGLAQLARASALHAEGRGFESHVLHHKEMIRTQ